MDDILKQIILCRLNKIQFLYTIYKKVPNIHHSENNGLSININGFLILFMSFFLLATSKHYDSSTTTRVCTIIIIIIILKNTKLLIDEISFQNKCNYDSYSKFGDSRNTRLSNSKYKNRIIHFKIKVIHVLTQVDK